MNFGFFAFKENYHGSNTMFLVGVLMSVVGFVFVTFTLMALCYRSVVVHRNFTLCLRLVQISLQYNAKKNAIFHPFFVFCFLVQTIFIPIFFSDKNVYVSFCAKVNQKQFNVKIFHLDCVKYFVRNQIFLHIFPIIFSVS